MFNSYYLRYRVRLDEEDKFLTMEVSGHYGSVVQVRREFEIVRPIMFQDRQTQERVKFKLLSVKENELGPYHDA